MSLTMGHNVFASINEDGFNKFIRAVRTARPKYFNYACPPLGSGVAGVDFYVIPPLPIPGTSSGMPVSVQILGARLDFTPAQAGLMLPSPLTLGPNQFALLVDLEVCFLCGALQKLPNPPSSDDRKNPNEPSRDPFQGDKRAVRDCFKLSVWAIGHPISTPNSHGGRDIGLHIDQIIVKDVGAMEALIECYTETMLNALLDAVRYSLEKFPLGSFGSLSLADGPQFADNQLKVWADIS